MAARIALDAAHFDHDVADEARAALKNVSTATLTTVLFKRGLRNQFIQDVRPLNPSLPNMVGEAFTLRYIPAREDLVAWDKTDNPQAYGVFYEGNAELIKNADWGVLLTACEFDQLVACIAADPINARTQANPPNQTRLRIPCRPPR